MGEPLIEEPSNPHDILNVFAARGLTMQNGKRFCLQNLIWSYDLRPQVQIAGIVLIALRFIDRGWLVLEASGHLGSPRAFFITL